MSRPFPRRKITLLLCVFALLVAVLQFCALGQMSSSQTILLPPSYGPFSGHFLVGGRGLTKSLAAKDPVLAASAPWTLSAWVEMSPAPGNSLLIAGVGDPGDATYRFFALVDGKPALRFGPLDALVSPQPFDQAGWHHLAASFDEKTASLYVDGTEVAHGALQAGAIKPALVMAPVLVSCGGAECSHFGGRIALFRLGREASTPQQIASLSASKPDFRLIDFEEGSKPWALQIVQFAGNTAPQDPSTLPQRRAPFSAPKVEPLPPLVTVLEPNDQDGWTLVGGWKLAEQAKVSSVAEQVAMPGLKTDDWMPATVPGTVLTTMIARGIYPDPDYGLNNLAIPESLNKQNYWYRAEFLGPSLTVIRNREHLSLIFDGINYQAEIWLNGKYLGSIKGAFTRGTFDVSTVLHPGAVNALAILVSPAPHPGIPNEQSIAFGAGLNGGAMAIDGPTFMATEGWDWFPPMRDRNTGLWQSVRLVANGSVVMKDPQVISRLPLPDITKADITINVPLVNVTDKPILGTLEASFEGVSIRKDLVVPPGHMVAILAPSEFKTLHLERPRLWWPNGYGSPELYHLRLNFSASGSVSSEAKIKFGVREVTYEISLLDNSGALRRVDYDPSSTDMQSVPAVDVTHEGMRQIPDGWAASMAMGQEGSSAFHRVFDTRASPYLILKVNGVRIAARGGSWGMDDSRKRISREHLEPYFRFDREANLNIIRNWQGQNTEEVFYELADEYGMMVWNDFWAVTMDSNAEAEDPQLFLGNAEDTILRYRNHPSIVLWCGRNEGVPQPILNKGLIALTHTLDGTRYYSPSSNQINLQTSGPYSYQDPVEYYTRLDRGFAVEVGTPSLPTLEWFSRWLPEVDRWPISDDWAYHNWHPYDSLNQHLQAQFGVADSLEDYERKAQMMNYVDYRAIFEGFNAHLWAPNGGRLLWMTQPAWPSTLWGILSSDYDTQASFYGTKKACEPVHIQLDLASGNVSIINTTRSQVSGVKVSADIYTIDAKLLQHREVAATAAANDVTDTFTLDLAPLMRGGLVFVRLALHAQDGSLLSDNFYWRAASDADYRALTRMAPARVSIDASREQGARLEQRIRVHLSNRSNGFALATKLVAYDAEENAQVLPAYYSDNYISLLPGEERSITIDLPPTVKGHRLRMQLRGWNAIKTIADVADK